MNNKKDRADKLFIHKNEFWNLIFHQLLGGKKCLELVSSKYTSWRGVRVTLLHSVSLGTGPSLANHNLAIFFVTHWYWKS